MFYHFFDPTKRPTRLALLAFLILIILFAAIPTVQALGSHSITAPDTEGNVGRASSLVLDSSGRPVISYVDNTSSKLKIMHCNDANCSGGNESITAPVRGAGPLVLDSNGYPVVAMYDDIAEDSTFKLMHCNDANCSGGNESITTPDPSSDAIGISPSLALDSNGYPVISYYDLTNGNLKVMHCNDANCSGGNESITAPDTGGDVGSDTSLELDNNGYPVISYYDGTNGNLKVMHCNDANCSGGNESITAPDTGGDVGSFTSLVLDSTGYPVISYYDVTNGNLKVMHCNDVNCSGGNESITAPDTGGNVGGFTSLALDSGGYPVISYYDWTNGDLKVMHCNDANCSGGNEAIVAPDTDGTVGFTSSMVLDNNGYPVVSYYDLTNGDLKLLHCGNTNCSSDSTPPTIVANVSGTLGSNGWYVGNVTVSWTVTDGESSINSSSGCGTGVISSDTNGTTLTCLASSNGGNSSSSVTIKRDATAPTASAAVSPAANANGWHNSDVTVSFSGSDALSGVASCTPNVVLSSEVSGLSANGTCTDNAGNVSATATTSGIQIDKTAPVVTVTGVSEGATYLLGSVPTAGCTTSDTLSGVATAATLSLSGGNSDGGGDFVAMCSGALDYAGNGGSATSAYTVLSPQDAIRNLIEKVDGLADNGVLKNGQANGLTQPLDNAIRSLDKGHAADACNQLTDFIAEVNAKTPSPLDAATAADLIADAEAIQHAIGCANGASTTIDTDAAADATSTTSIGSMVEQNNNEQNNNEQNNKVFLPLVTG